MGIYKNFSIQMLAAYLPKSYNKDIFNTKSDMFFNHIVKESMSGSDIYIN
jgi:hypothetical protein